MSGKTEPENEAYKILRDELIRREISYKNLARLLESYGVVQNDIQLKTKITRGKFSFQFFLLVMRAIDATTVILENPNARGGGRYRMK